MKPGTLEHKRQFWASLGVAFASYSRQRDVMWNVVAHLNEKQGGDLG